MDKCDHGGWHRASKKGELSLRNQMTVCPLCNEKVRKIMKYLPSPQLVFVPFDASEESVALLLEMQERGLRPDLILFIDLQAQNSEVYEYLKTIDVWLECVEFPPIAIFKHDFSATPNLSAHMLMSLRSPAFRHELEIKFLTMWNPAISSVRKDIKIIKVTGYLHDVTYFKRPTIKKWEAKHCESTHLLEDWSVSKSSLPDIIKKSGLPRLKQWDD